MGPSGEILAAQMFCIVSRRKLSQNPSLGGRRAGCAAHAPTPPLEGKRSECLISGIKARSCQKVVQCWLDRVKVTRYGGAVWDLVGVRGAEDSTMAARTGHRQPDYPPPHPRAHAPLTAG